jgi:hypothetical protein
MTNRIGGDFDAEVIEAFRAAYAQEMKTPNDNEVDQISGLPTNVVTNTSPWIEHTGLWKYPSGKGPDQDLKTAFDPNAYLSGEVVDGDEEVDSMSDEEVEHLINEISGEEEEEYDEEEGVKEDSEE